MLLIWGWRSLVKVLGIGEFHCPRCGVDRAYSLVRPRRWFTLFFIPVVPLSWGEPYVECQACKAAYRESVLSTPTSRQFSYMLGLAARALHVTVIATGFSHDEAAIERAALATRPYAGSGYNEANVVADMEGFRGHALAEYLSPFGQHATDAAKESLLHDAAALAYAEGACPPETREMLTGAGLSMGLSAAHTAGVIDSASAQRRTA